MSRLRDALKEKARLLAVQHQRDLRELAQNQSALAALDRLIAAQGAMADVIQSVWSRNAPDNLPRLDSDNLSLDNTQPHDTGASPETDPPLSIQMGSP